jgi:hypothetical protein
MKKVLFPALLAWFALAASAQTGAPAPAAPPECAAILARPFDAGLDPSLQPDCDSTTFYFGIGKPQDFATAQACALIERYQHVENNKSMFTGAGILSMVYANGEGTPRDLDRARRFVCENKEASANEMTARLALIDKIAATPVKPPHFDLCATASTGDSWGWCTSIQVREHDAKRFEQLVKMVDGISPEATEAFKKLQAAENEFESLRTEKEVNQNGAARWAWQLQEQDRIRSQFVHDMELFSSANFSQPATLAVVDGYLNNDLNKLQANATQLLQNTTVTWDGVNQTQQAWLKYRQAWRDYESLANPKDSSDAVETEITRERLFHIRKLLQQ